ncbi:SHOCT domain-containing protein [Nocardia sp. NPDC058640]|uniref:SHOCT domain-containing protein n=1 Tax=Nocardia sp. NPDC058640 TaxID=3346571 RepID=UPI00364A89A2
MSESPTSHGLGVGHGSLIEYPDGSVEYRATGKFLPAFRVRMRDVVGFSVRQVTRDDKKRLKASSLQQVLSVQGSGTTLAEVAINHGTAQKIEDWFHSHRDFGGPRSQAPVSQSPQPMGTASIADELMKLAQLRDAGVLTPAEFETQKARLLG